MADQPPTPTVDVAANASRGLDLREKHNRGGTDVGVARAESLRDRRPQSAKDIARMVSYFARHAVDKDAPKFGDEDDPSAGYIAWLLWGGDAGQDWANKHRDSHDAV